VLDYDRIAFRIWDLRKNRKKVSQKKMAEDLGMYQPDISALENNRPGSGIESLPKLELIAAYMGVSIKYLLFGNEDETEFPD
jgi:transcriptional regulator with XRE-family HTH domain